jgi:hypothetical protein
MTAAQQRRAQRAVHLAAGLLLIAYLYAPSRPSFKMPSASSPFRRWS